MIRDYPQLAGLSLLYSSGPGAEISPGAAFVVTEGRSSARRSRAVA